MQRRSLVRRRPILKHLCQLAHRLSAQARLESSTWITAADGGELSLDDGALVRVPPHALAEDGEVTFTRQTCGGVFASKAARSRTVTVAIEAMNFRKAVYVGDLVSVYANLVRVGRTSLTVHLEAWALRRRELLPILVTDGNFTYVSIDDNGRPQAIQRGDAPIAT